VELSPGEARDEYDNQLMTVTMGGFNHDKTALKADELNE
jgi:threonylcarbamoyladenosine tRNA methylthiotransferase MtaB